MPVSVIENASFGNSGIVTANGIKFPATQVASADANTLDDYEEGTWTPVLVSASGSITTQSGTGSYVKVGKVVTVHYRVVLTNAGTASGNMLVTSFPFNSITATGTSIIGSNVCRENALTGFTYQATIGANTTTMALFTLSTNANPPWTNGSIYTGSITYETT